MKTLESEIKAILKEELGIYPEKSTYELANTGLYLPKEKKAYVDKNNQIFSLARDYFGKATFCEHSTIGKKMTELEGNDLETFKHNKGDAILPLLPFHNNDKYNGFVNWLEAQVSEKLHLKEDNQKENQEKLKLDYFKDVDKTYGRFAFMCELGFPKNPHDSENIIHTLNKMGYSIKDDDLVVVYGSRKPESDIDLFIVSEVNNNKDHFIDYLGWLDIFQINKNSLHKYIKKLDYSVTDALITGDLLYGPKEDFEKIKKQIKEHPVTEEAINHNMNCAKKYKDDLHDNFSFNKRNEDLRRSNIKNYITNAMEMKKGNKPLTYKKLLEKRPLYKDLF
ncbi:MAG: hypothetical protein ACOCQG_01870 [Candidatus Nanoarchaeia archaeon]